MRSVSQEFLHFNCEHLDFQCSESSRKFRIKSLFNAAEIFKKKFSAGKALIIFQNISSFKAETMELIPLFEGRFFSHSKAVKLTFMSNSTQRSFFDKLESI